MSTFQQFAHITAQRRTACVSCGRPLSDDLVFIGEQYPSAIYPSADADYRTYIKPSSLNLAKCTHPPCGLVHLAHSYDLDYVFKHYPYVSSGTATMRDILTDVVRAAAAAAPLKADDVVLDIGGNDGTLLSLLPGPVRARVNIDPALGVRPVLAASDYVRREERFTAAVYRALDLPAPRLIFSVAMFYHLPDPLEFCRQVAQVMADDTVWCIQMTYLGSMLDHNIYDNIVHEHVAYYSLRSLEFLLGQVGLQICEAGVVRSYGGSLRVFVMKDPRRFPAQAFRREYAALAEYEEKTGLNTPTALVRFNDRIALLRECTRALVDHLVERHGKLWAFGASTKGNMLCQFLGLGRDQIAQALDNNEKKVGLIMTGSDIPVVSEREHLPRVPDYLLVLPYYYLDFFRSLIAKTIAPGRTVYLLVPLPRPYFVKITRP